MRFGSLFSGIGGLDLGLERAGLRCAWQVEVDEWCRRVLSKHWPDVPKFADIKELDGGELEPVDLICGGFPCQDLSYAGKGEGIKGKRSGLWSEFARILRVVRPRYALVENVPGLLGRGMGAVLGDLSSLGYDAEWEGLPASAFGAPHIRARIFIVAYPGRERDERRGEAEDVPRAARGIEEEGLQRQRRRDTTLDSRTDVPDADHPRREEQREPFAVFAEHCAPQRSGWWEIEPSLDRVVDGFPGRVEQLRGLGNAVVPQVAEYLGNLILEHERRSAA